MTNSVMQLLVGAASMLAVAHGTRHSRAFLAAKSAGHMQPELVARTLVQVEDEWKAQAAAFTECNTTAGGEKDACSSAPNAFEKSCHTVVNTVVTASVGDKAVAAEYMNDICAEGVLDAWHSARCQGLAQVVTDSMSADSYSNRNNFDGAGLCQAYWTGFLAGEQERLSKERAESEIEAKRKEQEEREEAEKKAALEAAEVKRQAEEATSMKAAEELKKAEEAEKANVTSTTKVVVKANASNDTASVASVATSSVATSNASASNAVKVDNVTSTETKETANTTASATNTANATVGTPQNSTKVPEATAHNVSSNKTF